ncbi:MULTISPECIES: KH domain-containing protein [Peptoniphilus]|jgi:protein ylqC|uniref:KH domain-containing protein n=1 Tax=Peptoniphilus TaxID=162289 RepID=UPI000287F3B5|nr:MULTISPECIES: KH domain-containing protein [Peptoniphilus]MBS6610060.1 KH domain-containing protein [Peptoniphilus harei]MDU1043452.1 KH domain-containing protein [Peptoniphilus rhinitidis]MDU1954167.1 KH domain-containing protein [Peptoniphilus lacydonensis]MDU2109900.1 KH domain-containing protein [Peptoniphilus lacydonensis]MDU2115903.1 KH domain-containing protein [Peptoniphilus lacydonensis]
MVELIEYIAKSLVDDPSSVDVKSEENGDVINITLKVASSDMGKIIGKQGRIAKAIRAIIKAVSLKENVKVNLEIEEY